MKDAAGEASYSERTARRRLGDEGFRARLDAGREELLAAGIARLAAGIEVAIDALFALAKGEKDSTPAARLGAAQALLKYAAELGAARDMDKRLAGVEELLEAALGRSAAA